MNFTVLPEDAFTAEYHKAFRKLDLATEAEKAAFREEVFTIQGAVLAALERKWKEEDDFAVGWDFDYCFHTCGGIYSDRIFCNDYVVAVRDALQSVDGPGRWTYHTVCEILVAPDAKTAGEAIEDRGEFFLRNGTCYINATRMKRDWRARLGCDE